MTSVSALNEDRWTTKCKKQSVSVTVSENLVVVKVVCWLVAEFTASFETGVKAKTWARERGEHNEISIISFQGLTQFWNV